MVLRLQDRQRVEEAILVPSEMLLDLYYWGSERGLADASHGGSARRGRRLVLGAGRDLDCRGDSIRTEL